MSKSFETAPSRKAKDEDVVRASKPDMIAIIARLSGEHREELSPGQREIVDAIKANEKVKKVKGGLPLHGNEHNGLNPDKVDRQTLKEIIALLDNDDEEAILSDKQLEIQTIIKNSNKHLL